MSKEFDEFMESVKQLADKSWEGCDGCTDAEETIYKNGYIKGYNAAINEHPKELSEEEIKEYATRHSFNYYEFLCGAMWYREQLKLKQPKQ
jgi:hypothetical protein